MFVSRVGNNPGRQSGSSWRGPPGRACWQWRPLNSPAVRHSMSAPHLLCPSLPGMRGGNKPGSPPLCVTVTVARNRAVEAACLSRPVHGVTSPIARLLLLSQVLKEHNPTRSCCPKCLLSAFARKSSICPRQSTYLYTHSRPEVLPSIITKTDPPPNLTNT